jgi:putative hydrolase of the HAD superfamily
MSESDTGKNGERFSGRQTIRLRACAFDLGNTLVNDARLMELAAMQTESWLRIQGCLSADQHFSTAYLAVNRRIDRPFISHTFGELCFFDEVFRDFGISRPTSAETLEKYREFLLGDMKLEPGAVEALVHLRNRGLKTALLTNESTERVEALFDKTQIRGLFDEVVISQDIQCEKPNPRFFQEALLRLGVEPTEMAMLGDNEIADGACKALGIWFVMVTALKRPGWGWERGNQYPPDYVIEKLSADSIDRFLQFAQNGQRAVESRRDSKHQ